MNNNERMKLMTKRVLAWGIALPVTQALIFALVWGVLYDKLEVVTLTGGILATTLGAVTAFYFSKKMSEE